MGNRRQEIFVAMTAAARARARRRVIRRTAVIVFPLLALAACVMLTVRASESGVKPGPLAARHGPGHDGRSRARLVEIVRTDPGIAAKVAVSEVSRVERIDDQELLRALGEAGLDSGIVRTGDRVVVTGLMLGEGHSGNEPASPSGV